MTNRDRILRKPQTVQTVLRMKITKETLNIEDLDNNFDKAAGEALAWWNSMMAELLTAAAVSKERPPSETEMAELVIARLRTNGSTWGKILRGNAN